MQFEMLNKTVGFIAKRASGKSCMLKWLVSLHKEQFDKIIVFCPTETISPFYEELTTKEFIFDEYNDEYILKLIDKMTMINSNKSKEKKKNVMVLLDDCMSDTDFLHQGKGLQRLFARGRHLNITVVLCAQYLNSCPPLCRNNFDYVICGMLNRMSVELLCNEYLSGDLEKKDFIKIYHRTTQDYGFLLINCCSIKDSADLNNIYGQIKTPIEYIK